MDAVVEKREEKDGGENGLDLESGCGLQPALLWSAAPLGRGRLFLGVVCMSRVTIGQV